MEVALRPLTVDNTQKTRLFRNARKTDKIPKREDERALNFG